MGCDIHLFKEKRVNGSWITADQWELGKDWNGNESMVCTSENYVDRNYKLFGLLCEGVRSKSRLSFKERGLPQFPCKEVIDTAKKWGVDGHSHSYLYLHELKDLLEMAKTETINVSGMMDSNQWERLKVEAKKDNPDWSIVYPHSQWSSRKGDVEFSIDVPMSFSIGCCLGDIIRLFDGIDGENHRIVFWFDN